MSSPNFHTNSCSSATVHHTNPYITLGLPVGEGEGFCKNFLRQKTCVGDGGECERALDDVLGFCFRTSRLRQRELLYDAGSTILDCILSFKMTLFFTFRRYTFCVLTILTKLSLQLAFNTYGYPHPDT